MRSFRHALDTPHTAMNADRPVTVATVWTVMRSEPVSFQMGQPSHETAGKKALDGMIHRGCT